MASGDTLTTPAQTETHHALRSRAVLYEDKRRRERQHRPRKHPPFCLLPRWAAELPMLARHLETHDGYPPNVARSAAARTRQLHAMFKAHGSLALLRFTLASLDDCPLHLATLPHLARELVAARLDALLMDDAPYTVDIHRGSDGGTHAHVMTPLTFVVDEWRVLLNAAPHGPGGGRELPDFAGHGVVMNNTTRDRERVAAYIRRHPDGRLWTPGTPNYLLALDDEVRRKAEGLRLPRLAWDGGRARALS